ncbi:MAG: endonuclease MutS2 [Peptococcaceae bacterium]|nr:endonuclease MutS2 [Peptococcaceae bacterium]
MDEKVLHKMEYQQVIQRLAEGCGTVCGKELAADLRPMTGIYQINQALEETSQAKELLRLFPTFTMGGVHDTRMTEKRALMDGIIEPADFLLLLDTLKAADRIRDFLKDPELPFPNLREIAYGLLPLPQLESGIQRVITQEGEVSDNATPELSRLRKKLRSLQGKAREKLEAMVRNPDIQKYLQEAIISIRNDRYVLPVRQEYRQQVPGIIHDQSGSGATLFVEPMAIVEINNETQQTELEERAEVNRILRQLTEQVKANAQEIQSIRESLTWLDFVLAKGKLSHLWDCGRPLMNEKGALQLKQARHPLIKGKVVPVTVSLGRDFDAVIITGPNTGGKTVLLKTMGLLTLMAQSGLHVPAEAGTELAVFQQVFADIGDEQSIEQSLSTFSAHITNIIGIADKADSNSLVLLDELGAGTDPAEGAALAMSIIEYLLKAGAKLVATTHYSELKSFASNRPRVENASVEFDVETLRPTYRLMMGIPGRSNAFEISSRLGLNPEIVEGARHFQSQEEARTANLIKDLEANQILSERERQEAEALRTKAADTLAWIQKKEEDAQRRMARELEKAREEALEIVSQARRESDRLLKEIREMQKAGVTALDQEAAQQARAKLKGHERELYDKLEELQPPGHSAPKTLEPGDLVYLRKLNQKGQVLARPNNQGEVLVQAGIMKLTVKLKDLELLPEDAAGTGRGPIRQTGAGAIAADKARTLSSELDLRGMLVDEAIDAVEKYLDDAYLAGLPVVNIIHGKGTGALRKAIRELAAKHPFVAGARQGGYNEGGDGVTIIEIKK